jgi:hypothetical protein
MVYFSAAGPALPMLPKGIGICNVLHLSQSRRLRDVHDMMVPCAVNTFTHIKLHTTYSHIRNKYHTFLSGLEGAWVLCFNPIVTKSFLLKLKISIWHIKNIFFGRKTLSDKFKIFGANEHSLPKGIFWDLGVSILQSWEINFVGIWLALFTQHSTGLYWNSDIHAFTFPK